MYICLFMSLFWMFWECFLDVLGMLSGWFGDSKTHKPYYDIGTKLGPNIRHWDRNSKCPVFELFANAVVL